MKLKASVPARYVVSVHYQIDYSVQTNARLKRLRGGGVLSVVLRLKEIEVIVLFVKEGENILARTTE